MEQLEYSKTLLALKTALLEIRATPNIEGAKILADIFHNVPGMIAIGKDPGDIELEVRARAESYNCWPAISTFFKETS